MSDNANRIVIVVIAIAVIAIIGLVINSGSCSGGGGGGGNASTVPNSSTTPSAPTSSDSAASTAADSANASASYEELRDKLLEELSKGTALVGANPRSASNATSAMTASQAHDELSNRGFGDLTLSASFDLSGAYLGPTDLDATSSERYPSYQATYKSASGVKWRIIVNDSKFFAVPVASDSTAMAKEIIFSETDGITQYDGVRNQYSDFDPNDLADATLVKVAKVDATTLDSYSPDTLSGL